MLFGPLPRVTKNQRPNVWGLRVPFSWTQTVASSTPPTPSTELNNNSRANSLVQRVECRVTLVFLLNNPALNINKIVFRIFLDIDL